MLKKINEIKSLSDLNSYVASQRDNINELVTGMTAQAADLLRTALVDKCLATAQSTQYYANMALTQLEAELPNAPRGNEKLQEDFVTRVKGIYLENTDQDAQKLSEVAAQLAEYHEKNYAHDAEIIDARLAEFEKFQQTCEERKNSVTELLAGGEVARAAQMLLAWPAPPEGLFEGEAHQTPICPKFVPAAEKLNEFQAWRNKLLEEKIPVSDRQQVEINLMKHRFYNQVRALEKLFSELAVLRPEGIDHPPARQAIENLMGATALSAPQTAAVKLVAEITDLRELAANYQRLLSKNTARVSAPPRRPAPAPER